MQSQLLPYNPLTPITEMRSLLRICSFLPTSALSRCAHTHLPQALVFTHKHTHTLSLIWLFRKTECKIAISVVQLLAILQLNLHSSPTLQLLEISTFTTGKMWHMEEIQKKKWATKRGRDRDSWKERMKNQLLSHPSHKVERRRKNAVSMK